MLKISAKAHPGETFWFTRPAGVGTATVQKRCSHGHCHRQLGRKTEPGQELGADFTINYKETDFVQPVLDFTRGKGADIIFESIGGDFIDRDIDAAAPFGRIVVFGMASGSMQPPNLAKMFKNSVAVSAFWMVTLGHHSDAMRETVQELLLMVSREGIRPIIGQV
jgi:NADPH2:quinone reductase